MMNGSPPASRQACPNFMLKCCSACSRLRVRANFAATDPLLSELLGRKPTSMRDFLRRALV